MSTHAEWLYATRQQEAARGMRADGQCRRCGAFRLDGQPPTAHRSFCPEWTPPKESHLT